MKVKVTITSEYEVELTEGETVDDVREYAGVLDDGIPSDWKLENWSSEVEEVK